MQKIAVAVKDTDLYLEAFVVRTPASDVYVNIHRNHDPTWKPHTSYHASGQQHHKSFGKLIFSPEENQKPDGSFRGTKHLVSFGLAKGESKLLNQTCNPTEYSDVFEIPDSLLQPEKYSTCVYFDLVEPGIEPVLYPGASILKQATYKDVVPWIVITLLHLP